MLLLEELSGAEHEEIRTACSYLFSPQEANDNNFLENLNWDNVRNTYLKKIKTYHPDMLSGVAKEAISKASNQFIKLTESYHLLESYLREWPADGSIQGKIIAIGGAKGGIGKSIISTNLGVLLASKRFKTVIVDLDLGKANLHIYLGEKYRPKIALDDYLNGTIPTIEEAILESKYGPFFIAGSTQPGIANIQFQRKLRLLKAIKTIKADYIILDLGGNTYFNTLDFFLMANYGIVVTTNYAASYLSAYSFIKSALYRKLSRIFGQESSFINKRRDIKLEQVINEIIMASNGPKIKSIEELKLLIAKDQPENINLINEVISDFKPYLVVNEATSTIEVDETVDTIQTVSSKFLSINVRYLGSISEQAVIKNSIKDIKNIVPAVLVNPYGIKATKEIGSIIKGLNLPAFHRPS